MFRRPFRSLALLGASAILGLVATTMASRAEVYRCTMKSGVSTNDNGFLEEGGVGVDWFINNYRRFTFDTATGLFATAAERHRWEIRQKGGGGWDFIASLPGTDPLNNILRIEEWRTPITFAMTDGSDFFSGTCRLPD